MRPLQIDDRGRRIELLEYLVRSLVLQHLRYTALRIAAIAEHHRLGRTALHARGRDLAVAHLATAVVLRRILREPDALDAEGTLLHDALLAHSDVGIELLLE